MITRNEIFSFRVVCLLEMVSWVRLKMETGRSVVVRLPEDLLVCGSLMFWGLVSLSVHAPYIP